MGDKGAVALAEDPDAAYSELLGLAEGQTLRAVFQTSQGDLTCVLRHDLAPVTVANFVALAEGSMPWMHPETGPTQEPLYDGTVFHRVIPEFMVQGGDPVGTGSGGPGYRFLDEIHRQLRFDQPGRLAMANQGPHTNGSQFFVTEVPTPHLDGRHTIFGECDETSVEVVKRMTRVPSEESRPVEPLLLERVEIQRQP
ncbi:MAG: peptidylprolyl isomerase [Myxococcales bacterium]|nr:peptidylprolyl isomerase [Myxococcales bacterium]